MKPSLPSVAFNWFNLWLAIIACLLLTVLLAGCSTIHERTSLTTAGTNEVRTTEMTIRTLFDSKQAVGSTRASNGKTQSVGAKDVAQESTSTGIEAIVGAAVRAAVKP